MGKGNETDVSPKPKQSTVGDGRRTHAEQMARMSRTHCWTSAVTSVSGGSQSPTLTEMSHARGFAKNESAVSWPSNSMASLTSACEVSSSWRWYMNKHHSRQSWRRRPLPSPARGRVGRNWPQSLPRSSSCLSGRCAATRSEESGHNNRRQLNNSHHLHRHSGDSSNYQRQQESRQERESQKERRTVEEP